MTKQIPLSQGKFSLVDDEDYDFLMQWKWYFLKGYAIRGSYKKTYMHRVVNHTPDLFYTDHINHDKLDNRRCNLRVCTTSQNSMNQLKHNDGKSKFKGVTWHKKLGKWQAQLRTNGVCYYLGVFDNEENAAMAYNNAAEKMFVDFSLVNNIK